MGALRTILRLLVRGRRDGVRSRLLRRAGLSKGCSESPADAEDRSASAEPIGPAVAPAPAAPAGTPQGFEGVLDSASLPEGGLVEVFSGGRAIALARVAGAAHAVSNVCPHAGGPIGDGTLEGHHVTCPYHGWSFDIRDGTCAVSPDVELPRYEVREADGVISVRVS
jgi:nitrite reductase (NADH) small subunit